MDVQDFYQQAITQRGFTADEAQRNAVKRLQLAYEEWREYKSRRSTPLKRLFNHPNVPRGVYLWGGVGRGKSFLMDGFYLTVPLVRKTRIHFHEFMRGVHAQLDELRHVADPLDEVARRVAKKHRLICFDEFHVSDIADAMILYNLLKALFEQNVSMIMTSNYAPDQLYPDGLHRDRIFPAITLIKERMDVLNVDGGTDYRVQAMERIDAYHVPLNAAADQALREAFTKIAETADEDPRLLIESREIRCLRRAGGIIWFDFATLCGGPRSQHDYLEIASRFHTLILSGVPRMTPAMSSEARRFTWLIDVLYDRKIKLLMSAEVLPHELYTEGILSSEFQRTVSRLIEMQTSAYMRTEKRAAVNLL